MTIARITGSAARAIADADAGEAARTSKAARRAQRVQVTTRQEQPARGAGGRQRRAGVHRALALVLAVAVLAGCQLVDRSDGHRVQRVMIVGDSVMWGAAPAIDQAFSTYGAQVNYVGLAATGPLWNNKQWLTWVKDRLATFKPDLVIFEACCLYPGAAWPAPTGGGQLYVNSQGVTVQPDTPLMFSEWDKAVRELVAAARAAGATPWWVTLPPATEASRYYGTLMPERMAQLTTIHRNLGVPIVDWGVPAAADPSIRYPDGIHFTDAGYRVVADYTLQATTELVDGP